MKICVYAICKNESQFVERWMSSMSEADQIVVLDTGSTDDTVERLRSLGAQVTVETICPWRFDVARNRSLELVDPDADICVCTDLDEVFHPGWRKALENAWVSGATQATYRYTWSFRPDGGEGVVFWYEKIHARHGYQWVHPVHEVLEWVGPGQPGLKVSTEGIQLDHHPDPEKSRAQYLPLLELAVAETPQDDRSVHYLGREYLFRGRWDDCIRTLKRHRPCPPPPGRMNGQPPCGLLPSPMSTRNSRRRPFAGICGRRRKRLTCGNPSWSSALLLYTQEEWDGVLYFTQKALNIRERPHTYICEARAWGALPYDLRCQAYYHTGRPQLALESARAALALEPQDERLQGNVKLLEGLC